MSHEADENGGADGGEFAGVAAECGKGMSLFVDIEKRLGEFPAEPVNVLLLYE